MVNPEYFTFTLTYTLKSSLYNKVFFFVLFKTKNKNVCLSKIWPLKFHNGSLKSVKDVVGYNFCTKFRRLSMWQLETTFCLSFHSTGVNFGDTLVRWVSKKSSVDQSELEKDLVSHCKRNYMFDIEFSKTKPKHAV